VLQIHALSGPKVVSQVLKKREKGVRMNSMLHWQKTSFKAASLGPLPTNRHALENFNFTDCCVSTKKKMFGLNNKTSCRCSLVS